MSTRSRKALLAHNSCGKECTPCTDCAFKHQLAIDEEKLTSQMMRDQHEAHKEFRAQDQAHMNEMRRRLEDAYLEADAQRAQKRLAVAQAVNLKKEKDALEVLLAMNEGKYEGALETIEGLRQELDEARRNDMPALEPRDPRTPHKRRRTVRPTLVTPPAPPLPPGSDEDCFCGEETETEEEGSVSNPIKL
jgi:hypothetical protein